MHDILHADETFDLNYSLEYHLSIQLGLDGFSFSVLDTVQRKYVLLRHIPLVTKRTAFLTGRVREIFDAEEILNKPFKSISVVYHDQRATLVPSVFTDDSLLRSVVDLNQELDRHEAVAACSLTTFAQDVVFAYPEELRTLLDEKFSNYRFFHSTYSLLNAAVQQKGKSTNTVVINFSKYFFHLIVLKSNIRFFNSFYYKNEGDFLFHTLNVCKQLGIDAEKDELLLSGWVPIESDYIRQLKKYMMHVNFMKPDYELHYSYTFDKTPSHYFAGLLNAYRCEL